MYTGPGEAKAQDPEQRLAKARYAVELLRDKIAKGGTPEKVARWPAMLAEREAEIAQLTQASTPDPEPWAPGMPTDAPTKVHVAAVYAGNTHRPGPQDNPPAGKHADGQSFSALKGELKRVLYDSIESRFAPLVADVNDYDAAFRDLLFAGVEQDDTGQMVVTLSSSDPRTSSRGLVKYAARMAHLMEKHFGEVMQLQLRNVDAA
jgi:hypothetical protein